MSNTISPTKPFKVCVQRYWDYGNGCQRWDAFFISEVYAISGTQFLVYDDGNYSSSCGEEGYVPQGFMWVDYTETIPDPRDWENRYLNKVTLSEDSNDRQRT